MKISVFEVESWERGPFEDLAQQHEVRISSDPLSVSTVSEHEDAEVISTFLYSKVDRDVLRRLRALQLIATRSTGVDHIDLDFCRDHGVTVCNVPTYGKNTVAEHVFGLLLTISHNLEAAIDRTRKGDFSSKGLRGFDLYGKTMGIVGTGDIGCETARIAVGFGMTVVAHDLRRNEKAAAELGFEYVELDELLARSDVISLHVPATESTRHMIAWPQFQRMKDGAVLINTARGEILETRSLVRALAEKKLAAAGLDVLPQEPVIREEAELLRSVYEETYDLGTLLANQVLVHMRNVIVTPHSAFNTREAVQRILDTTVENIEAFAAGNPCNVAGTQ
jgi:D-lactate dehydrogenase